MNQSRGLKTRTPLSNAVKTELLVELKQLSAQTKVPISKLLDEAIEDLLIKRKPANK
ncbi:ribbon-helix-helix domain-containing protein [Bacillus sp. JJ634]